MYVFLLSHFFDKYFLESRVLDLHLCHKFFPGNFVTHFSNTDCLSADCWARYLAFFSVFSPAWAIIDFCFLDNFLSGASLDFLTGPECLELTGGGYTLHNRLNISINPELVWESLSVSYWPVPGVWAPVIPGWGVVAGPCALLLVIEIHGARADNEKWESSIDFI